MRVFVATDEGGDWVALYKDFVLVAEGHSLSVKEVVHALGIEYSHAEFNFEEFGSAPSNLEELLR